MLIEDARRLVGDVEDFRVGTTPVKAVYLGDVLVWPPELQRRVAGVLLGGGQLEAVATVFTGQEIFLDLFGDGALLAFAMASLPVVFLGTGTGTLIATTTQTYALASTPTGSGTLSALATGHAVGIVPAVLSGSGALSVVVVPIYAVTPALLSDGALSAIPVGTYQRTVALSGDGILSATTMKVAPIAAPLIGDGTLSATATASYPSAPAPSGSGTLSATTVKVAPVAPALSGSGTLSATVTPVAASTLLGEWGFLDNLLDTSGNGHAGTFTAGAGGSLTYGPGPQSNTRAATFSHVQDLISFGNTGLEPTADGVTTMGWMKLVNGTDAPGAGLVGLLSKARASASSRSRIGMKMLSNARTIAYVARWKDNLHNDDVMPGYTPDANWHHIALVDGNTSWVVYVDGVQYANGTRAFDNTTNPTWEAQPWISGYNSLIGDQYAGPNLSVSGIRIFRGQLTGAQVTTWMNTPVTPRWTNRVTVVAPRNGTTTHTVDPNGGAVVTGSSFTPTAGRLLVCVGYGAVTSTTPSGWTLPTGGSAINNGGMYVWWKIAVGGDTVTTTHNGSNYPVAFEIFEFPAGATFKGSASASGIATAGGAGPTLSGMTGLTQYFAVRGVIGFTYTTTWAAGSELTDTNVATSGTDGYTYSSAYLSDSSLTSWSAAATFSTVGQTTAEGLVFGVGVP